MSGLSPKIIRGGLMNNEEQSSTHAEPKNGETESEILRAQFPWVRDPATDRAAEHLTVTDVVDAVLRTRRHIVLGALFDRLSMDVLLSTIALGARIENLLAAQDHERFSALADHTIDDIAGWRGVGEGSLRELLTGLVDASINHAISDQSEVTGVASGESPPGPEWLDPLAADLLAIASWRRLLGAGDLPLLASGESHSEPRDVRAARARLMALTAESILPLQEHGAAVVLLQRTLHGLDERQLEIVRQRLVADDPRSLGDLGDMYGVSRERIRQIEAKLDLLLRSRVHSGELGALAAAARGAAGVVLPLRALLQRYPTLGEIVPELGQPVWRVLDRLDDAYEIEDGWCVPGSVNNAISRTRAILEDASRNGRFVEIEAVAGGVELSEEWLDYASIPTVAGYALLGRGSIPDRAEVVLHHSGEPQATGDLLAQLGVDRSVNALKNALAADDRFERVDRDRWALSEWGMDGYAPIHMLIGRVLDASGGSIPLADLIADLTGRFAVSAKSVVAYASGFPYTTDSGVVRRRTRRDMRKRVGGRGLADTKALFRFADDVRLRVRVNREHVRGSGSHLPNALGEELDLGIGESRVLTSPTGGVQLTRPRGQILLGSVRSEITRLDATDGDVVFFVFGIDGSLRLEPIEKGGIPEERVASMAGGLLEGGSLLDTLADRIDLQDATHDGIRAALAARGDSELVEMLDELRSGAAEAQHVELRVLDDVAVGAEGEAPGGVRAAIDDIFHHLLENVDMWSAQTYRRGSAFAPYVQGLREFDGGFTCELSSNAFLQPPLREGQMEALRFLGWRDPEPSVGLPNFHQTFEAGVDIRAIAEMLTKTLVDALELDSDDDIEFGPHSPELDRFVARRLHRSE